MEYRIIRVTEDFLKRLKKMMIEEGMSPHLAEFVVIEFWKMGISPSLFSQDAPPLAQSLPPIEREVREMHQELLELHKAFPVSETMRVTDIARKLGVTQATLYRKPWNLPNFGIPDIGHNPRRWLREKVFAWYERPEPERRVEWEKMSPEEKEFCLRNT